MNRELRLRGSVEAVIARNPSRRSSLPCVSRGVRQLLNNTCKAFEAGATAALVDRPAGRKPKKGAVQHRTEELARGMAARRSFIRARKAILLRTSSALASELALCGRRVTCAGPDVSPCVAGCCGPFPESEQPRLSCRRCSPLPGESRCAWSELSAAKRRASGYVLQAAYLDPRDIGNMAAWRSSGLFCLCAGAPDVAARKSFASRRICRALCGRSVCRVYSG